MNTRTNIQKTEIQRTGEPIWTDLYMVRVPYKATIPLHELQAFGLPTMGNHMLDQQIHNEIVTVYITIDAMVEHYRAGTCIIIPNNEDLEAIYTTLNNYLGAWNRTLHHAVNTGNAPIEDLLLIDKFAGELYQQARLINGRKVPEPINFGALFGSSVSFSRDTILKDTNDKQENAAEDDDKHESFASVFARKLVGTATPVATPRSSRWKQGS